MLHEQPQRQASAGRNSTQCRFMTPLPPPLHHHVVMKRRGKRCHKPTLYYEKTWNVGVINRFKYV
eukprot:1677957-Pleurochrysis_carterae.AAC.1